MKNQNDAQQGNICCASFGYFFRNKFFFFRNKKNLLRIVLMLMEPPIRKALYVFNNPKGSMKSTNLNHFLLFVMLR